MYFRRTVTVAVLAFAVTAVSTSTANAVSASSDGTVTANDVSAALVSTTGVAKPGSGHVSVGVPADSSQPVSLQGVDGRSLSVKLPQNGRAGVAKMAAAGAVAFSGTSGSASAVVPTADGAQMLTVIKSRKAPTTYTYNLGASYAVPTDNGGAIIKDSDGKDVARVAPAWAKDAKGKSVPTRYTTNGNTLTQVVDHKVKGITYPVVADPYYQWYWDGVVVTLSRGDMAAVAYGGANALIPMLMVPGVGWVAIAAVLYMAGSAAWAYANRKCFWFYLRVFYPFKADAGYYDC